MAVELSDAKGSLKATAEELGITQILTRWRRERAPSQAFRTGSETQENREQQEILLLKKQLIPFRMKDCVYFYPQLTSQCVLVLLKG